MIMCPKCKHSFIPKGLYIIDGCTCPSCYQHFYVVRKKTRDIIFMSSLALFLLAYNVATEYLTKIIHIPRLIFVLIFLCIGVVGIYAFHYILIVIYNWRKSTFSKN